MIDTPPPREPLSPGGGLVVGVVLGSLLWVVLFLLIAGVMRGVVVVWDRLF